MTIRVALCGNPNVGKTSLFNALTGMRQYVANWPGVTVEVKEGVRSWKGHQLIITDLPGTYSLFATSLDEKIARDFLLYNTPDVVVVVADALSMEQGLYLLLEILELEARAILVVNAIDEAKKKGLIIDKQELSKHLK
ncbi:MAG: FeoB small GTPase domain-containing protein, partial [Pseudothermotoga sp.]